jgi:hypothetical protein
MADRTCLFCNKVFSYPNQLKRHQTSISCLNTTQMESLQSIIEYNCDNCNFITRYKHSYVRHSSICKINTTKKPFTSLTNIIENLQQQIALLVKQQESKELQVVNPSSQNAMLNGDNNKNTIVNGDIKGDVQNNTIQNNTIQNSNNNNTIINLINPFGYESLSNISLDKLPSIFINIDSITEKLCNVMYENAENKNFFKLNITRPDVSVFTHDLKLKSIQEERFIKDYFINIIFNYFIRIIHEYKNKLSIEDFSSYMKKAIVYEKIARNIDLEDPHDQTHIEIIKGYIHDFSRDKEVQLKIKDTIILITKEEHVRHCLLQKIDEQNIPTILDEYNTKDTTLTIEDKESNRNLYHYKKEFCLELLKAQNPGKHF